MGLEIRPFLLEVPETQLADLRQRLRQTRWPEAEPVSDWSQGVPLAYLRDLCGYWADGYDWRAAEARLNALPLYQAEIDGIRIVFAHVRSPRPDALPLILTHGWPGSVVEFGKVVGPLADPAAHGGNAADAFHVVCPCLPGYGFSGQPDRTGWGVERIARAWAELMARLGYARYGAAGSDWGTSVSTLYWESIRQVNEWIAGTGGGTVDVPTGCSVFPRELQRPSRRWAERRFTDIRYWGEPERGGHFAAFEQPQLFAAEIRSFFRLVR
jgi:pimeloyl-ACP methyl ester carboxylesterase